MRKFFLLFCFACFRFKFIYLQGRRQVYQRKKSTVNLNGEQQGATPFVALHLVILKVQNKSRREAVYTLDFTIKLVRTADGWRFDEFHSTAGDQIGPEAVG